MWIRALALAVLFATLGSDSSRASCVGRTGFTAGTVGEPAGRMRDRGALFVLENSEHPSVLIFDTSCSPPRRLLLQTAGRLGLGGIAHAADGALCVVTLDGRSIECFDESSGRRVRRRDLGLRVQSVWTIGGGLVYARFEARTGRPILFRESPSGFSEEPAFTSQTAAPDSETGIRAPGVEAAAMVANLIQCGLGPQDATPCWRMLTGEIRFVGGAARAPVPMPEVPGRARSFPLRDALFTPNGVLWLLVNDPAENKDEPVGAGRRLARLEGGRIRVETLGASARAILDGDDGGVLILYRDGSASRRGGETR